MIPKQNPIVLAKKNNDAYKHLKQPGDMSTRSQIKTTDTSKVHTKTLYPESDSEEELDYNEDIETSCEEDNIHGKHEKDDKIGNGGDNNDKDYKTKTSLEVEEGEISDDGSIVYSKADLVVHDELPQMEQLQKNVTKKYTDLKSLPRPSTKVESKQFDLRSIISRSKVNNEHSLLSSKKEDQVMVAKSSGRVLESGCKKTSSKTRLGNNNHNSKNYGEHAESCKDKISKKKEQNEDKIVNKPKQNNESRNTHLPSSKHSNTSKVDIKQYSNSQYPSHTQTIKTTEHNLLDLKQMNNKGSISSINMDLKGSKHVKTKNEALTLNSTGDKNTTPDKHTGIIQRHMNQLFVRGDNVVLVALAD